MSKVLAHWDEIAKAVQLAKGTGTIIIGNGDVKSLEEAKIKAEQYGVDGIMIGRGIFENPWLFNRKSISTEKNKKERLSLLVSHTGLFETLWGGDKHFDYMKKFFKIYTSGWPDAKELRNKLMNARNKDEVFHIVSNYR